MYAHACEQASQPVMLGLRVVVTKGGGLLSACGET